MRMRNKLFSATIALVLLLMMGLAVVAAPASQAESNTVEQALDAALSYLRTQQLPSGGIDSFGMGSGDPAGTAKAVIAVVATERSAEWAVHPTSGLSMVDFLAAEAVAYTHEAPHTDSAHLFPMQAGTLLAAVAAADADPTRFGGMNLLGQINDTYIAATGAYSTTAAGAWFTGEATPLSQAWVILGLSTAGQPVPAAAATWLVERQDEAGSWASDPDTTGLAITALIGSGHVSSSHAAIQRALAWLKAEQLPSGGWRPTWDSDPANANSTGMILQALAAAGHTSPATSWATANGDPIQALLALQKADGRIGGTYANAFSTIDAILGLSGQPAHLLSSKGGRQVHALTASGQVRGSLSGSRAGAFTNYVLTYPGGMADLRVRATFAPMDPSFSNAIGFNVYGGDAFDQRSARGDGPDREFSYRAQDAATLTIQVFNYSDHTVNYTLDVTGLPATEPTKERVMVEPMTDTSVADSGDESVAPFSGTLVGDSAGAFALYTISYLGDGSRLKMTMIAPPLDPSFAGMTGFNVYDPRGNLVAEGILRSARWERVATLSSHVAGEYLVQVYNYADGMALDYTLTIGD
jgi:hypothetical protein